MRYDLADMRLLALLLFPLVVAAQPKPAFDVASVKSTKNFQPGYGGEVITVRPGSLIMKGVRIRAMIKWAYDVKDYQITAPAWMGRPFWLGSDIERFEVQAKAPADTPVDQMKAMLRSLLAERFKLVTHREPKEVPALIATAVKPNLKTAADPDAVSRAVPTGQSIMIVNATVGEYLDLMSGPAMIPVIDRTGITGRYDIPLTLPAGTTADDLTYNLIQSLRENLGLKIEKQKTTIEMLIVDSAEKRPAEN